jgi:hypothetical protein
MKTSLQITALFLAASFPGLAIVEILGANLPAVFNVSNVATVFSLVLIGLVVVGDYSRRTRLLRVPTTCTNTKPNRETHRLAA